MACRDKQCSLFDRFLFYKENEVVWLLRIKFEGNINCYIYKLEIAFSCWEMWKVLGACLT
jgi:hypothetical protein